MTETWTPCIGDDVRCTDTSYTGCEERPVVGQIGKVVNTWKDPDSGFSVLVIKFPVIKETKLATENKSRKTFKEYFCTKRQPYLYFEPVRLRKRAA